MTQYNTLNVNLYNSQLDKLKSLIRNGAKMAIKQHWKFHQIWLVIIMMIIIYHINCYQYTSYESS